MGRVTGTLGVSGKLSKTRCWNDWGMGLMMEGGGMRSNEEENLGVDLSKLN